MYYYRARYYHPRLQRFLSEDPLGFKAGDVNLYNYVTNNPVWFIDPLGLDPFEVHYPNGDRGGIPMELLDVPANRTSEHVRSSIHEPPSPLQRLDDWAGKEGRDLLRDAVVDKVKDMGIDKAAEWAVRNAEPLSRAAAEALSRTFVPYADYLRDILKRVDAPNAEAASLPKPINRRK